MFAKKSNVSKQSEFVNSLLKFILLLEKEKCYTYNIFIPRDGQTAKSRGSFTVQSENFP